MNLFTRIVTNDALPLIARQLGYVYESLFSLALVERDPKIIASFSPVTVKMEGNGVPEEEEKEVEEDGSSITKKPKRQREVDGGVTSSPPLKKSSKGESCIEDSGSEDIMAIASSPVNPECDVSCAAMAHVSSPRFSRKKRPYLGKYATAGSGSFDSELSKSCFAAPSSFTGTQQPRRLSQDITGSERNRKIVPGLVLSKSKSEDSMDISLTDNLCFDTSLTESGDFSGTDCDSLSTSQVFPFDDASIGEEEPRASSQGMIKDSTTCVTEKREKRKRRSRKSKGSSKKGVESKAGGGIEMKNVRPNYFVGIQISNPDIHKGVVKIQEYMIRQEESLLRALIDVATMHITLLVAHIDNEEGLKVASSALTECGVRVKEELSASPLHLTFSGINNFGNQVVYAQIVEDDHYHRLLDLGECVRRVFAERQVCMPDTRTLHPHLTIAKLSKAPRIKGKHTPRKIDPLCYSELCEEHLGCQTVKGLQLLAMNKPKDQNRYYYSSAQVLFGIDKRVEDDDHSQCCFPRRPPPISTPIGAIHRNFSTVAPSTCPGEGKKREGKDVAKGSVNSWVLPTVGVLTVVALGALLTVIVPRLRNR